MLCFPNNGTVLKQAEGEKALQIFTTVRKKNEVARKKITEKLNLLHRNIQYERKVITLIQNILQVMSQLSEAVCSLHYKKIITECNFKQNCVF